jgi:hypothetical protein
MVKKLVIGLGMVMVLLGSGYAYDYDAADCDNDQMAIESQNVTCLGFVDFTNPTEVAELQDALGWVQNVFLGHIPSEIPPVIDGGATGNIRFDNMRYPDSMNRPPNSKISLTNAIKNGKLMPQVRAYLVYEPGDDCTPDSDWHFRDCVPETGLPEQGPHYYTGQHGWPVKVYMFDWDLSQEAIDACQAQDWTWDWGDGSPCDLYHQDNDNDGLLDGFAGVTMRSVGETVKASDVVNVEWVEGGEIATPKYSGIEEYIYMTYNTGKNSLEQDPNWPGGAEPTVFFNHFSKQAELGPQNFIVTLSNGQKIESINNVYSNLVMPTVAAKSYYTDLVATGKQKKRGKKIKATEIEVEVPNITAREIDGRLLIQWSEPDGAMTLPDGTRLRIYVGEGWFNTDFTGDDINTVFLWMDVPLHTGSVVVPSEYYEWIKARMTDGKLTIGGMYRQQWGGEYHNRGYFEGISFDIP